MRPTLRTALFAGCAAALLAIPGAHGQDQKIELRAPDASGDLVEVETVRDKQISLQVVGDPATSRFDESEQAKYRVEVLAVEEERPTRVRFVFERYRSASLNPLGVRQETVSPIEGRTIVVERQEAGVSITADPPELPDEHRSHFELTLDVLDQDFLPGEAVGPGDEWEVPAQAVSALFQGGSGSITCRFEEIVTFQGQRCVRIGLTMRITVRQPDDPLTTTVDLTGALHHSLELNRSLGMNLAGTTTVSGEISQDGVVSRVEGSGEFRSTEIRRWLKVDGREITGDPGR